MALKNIDNEFTAKVKAAQPAAAGIANLTSGDMRIFEPPIYDEANQHWTVSIYPSPKSTTHLIFKDLTYVNGQFIDLVAESALNDPDNKNAEAFWNKSASGPFYVRGQSIMVRLIELTGNANHDLPLIKAKLTELTNWDFSATGSIEYLNDTGLNTITVTQHPKLSGLGFDEAFFNVCYLINFNKMLFDPFESDPAAQCPVYFVGTNKSNPVSSFFQDNYMGEILSRLPENIN